MRIVTPLAAALALATTVVVPLDRAADPPRASTTISSVVQPASLVTAERASATGYAFFAPNRRDRVAVSWDRSIPVTYLIARRDARPYMFATIRESFRRARVQTGIRFRYGGRIATSEPIGTPERPVVIIDFGTARSHPRLAKYDQVVYAVGGPYLVTNGSTGAFTGGQVTIDVRTTRGIGRAFRHGQLGATLMHELGHVLGLAHVSAPGQLMAPGRIRADISGWFHDGDLRGLRRLIHD